MEKIRTDHEVTVEVAIAVLWYFGDTNLGREPGHFVTRLLRTMAAADTANFAKLREAFPGYAEAFRAVARETWGLEWLRTMVRAA